MNADSVIITGETINKLHFATVLSAFSISLFLACHLHYYKVVKNAYFGYPQEWIPSVSAAIGDKFPERNIFQLLMALAAIFRMALLLMSSQQLKLYNAKHQKSSFWVGFARMWLAGFWIYCPSGECNTFHDASMIAYLIATVIYHNLLAKAKSSVDKSAPNLKTGKYLIRALLIDSPILILFFVLHKVYRVPGAYSWYAFFEWFLVIIDALLDYYAFEDILQPTALALFSTAKLH